MGHPHARLVSSSGKRPRLAKGI